MCGPLLTVLHLIPQGVLAGLFFIMGFQALAGNGITVKVLFLMRDSMLTEGGHPLLGNGEGKVRRGAVWAFVGAELVGFAATFVITQTVAAVGFPVVIFALIPARALLLPRWLTPEELAVLDGPTASPFTMESVGGSFGGPVGGGGGGVLDDGEGGNVLSGESGEETERVGRKKEEGSGAGGGGGVGGRSDEELAELGESRSGAVRRRLSTLHREESV
jgi:hypothetical protein